MPYNKELLLQVLLADEYRSVDESGKVYPPAHNVYTVISEKMRLIGCEMTARHIYTILNENRNGFKEVVCEKYGCSVAKEPRFACPDPDNSSKYETSNEGFVSSKNIKLVLSYTKWRKFMPIKKISSGRVYWKFQQGWTDIIAERLCQQHSDLDCVFSFKNNSVTPGAASRHYAMFTGFCVECDSKITGILQKEPANDVDVIFTVTVENMDITKHSGTKKRQLRGQRRKNICQKIIDEKKDAITYRREEAKRLKKFGGHNVAVIPNTAVLRKAKEQHLLKMHGLEYSNAPLNLLQQAKFGKFSGSIHSISLLKFNCTYWSPEQQQVYTSRVKKDPQAVLSIDATGGIEKRKNKEDPHVFLYQCMLATAEGSVPVFQMVSADQRSLTIAHFLRQILAKGAPPPPSVVCDFGRAIINAIAEIFGRCCDLPDYLQRCYNILNNVPCNLPATYIRLDVSHLISMVSRWKCLKNKVIAARRLYLRCIAQAYQMDDFQLLSSFIHSVLVVALSEYTGLDKNGTEVPSQICLRQLNTTIVGITECNEDQHEDEEGDDAECDDCEDSDDEGEEINSWKSWSQNILSSAEKNSQKSKAGDTINGCHNPKFAARLKKQLLPYIPIWTGIMRQHFGRGGPIASSSSVEAEFSNLKNRVFLNRLPMRIDRFVLDHLDYIDGRIIDSSTKKDVSDEETIKDESYSDSANEIKSDDIWNECEDWGGLVMKTQLQNQKTEKNEGEQKRTLIQNKTEQGTNEGEQRRRPTYLDKCPEWMFIKDAKVAKLPILINGNFTGAVNLGKCTINVRNTCGFDSIVQLLMGGIVTNTTYKEAMEQTDNTTMRLALNIVADAKNPNSKVYAKRAEILSGIPIFSVEEKGRRSTGLRERLNAECNAAHLAEFLLADIPSCTRSFACQQCSQSFQSHAVMLHVNVDTLLCMGLESMQQAVDECQLKMSTCRRCQNVNEEVVEYGPHIIIDTSIVTDERYTLKNKKNRHDLQSIASTISIHGKTYLLAGVVNWIPGHYFAFVKCGLYWHEYNDIGPVRKCVTPNTLVTPHVILYTLAKNL